VAIVQATYRPHHIHLLCSVDIVPVGSIVPVGDEVVVLVIDEDEPPAIIGGLTTPC